MAAHNSSLSSGDGEAPPTNRHRGGWTTTPFISATVFALMVAACAWSANLIVFLIKEYNIKAIDAAQINNIVAGCMNFLPLVGAVFADSILGCFPVIWISSLISLLGLLLLLLSVTVDGFKPPACQQAASNLCSPPSLTQYTILYSAIALATIGVGGTRFTLATMGANQFAKIKHQASFFNWYFFAFYSASIISYTGLVYVEDNLGWGLGLGIGIAGNVVGLALFLIGAPYYTRDKPHASPFMGLLHVVVASIRKRKALISAQPADYYYGDHDVKDAEPPTDWFRPLNRAALKTEGDVGENGSAATPWKLCTVQQVEDLKSLIRILYLWSSSIFLGTPIGMQISLTVVQALASNRHITGGSFQFSAGSIIVFAFISTTVGIIIIDHCLSPLWKRTTGKTPTFLQQIGIGHVFTFTSMAVSALVESKRRSSAASGNQMSVMWLVPQLVIVGFGEAFLFPGQVGLYYQEFPACLKSLATAMVAMLLGVAFYLGTAMLDFIRRITDWLPNDINSGRVDNVYWVMMMIGVINFGYFLVVSWFYCKYRNVRLVTKEKIVSNDEK